jgi:EmrB/QacA subfamily drug resistance transporter
MSAAAATESPAAVGTGPAVRHGAVLAVTCIALGAVVSAMSSLNVALPSIAVATHASQTQLSWIIDAYSLVFASLLLTAGAIGDRFGRRLVLLVGLSVFGLASLAAVFTTSAGVLIGLRGLLGVGASLVMPATLSTITSTFPREQRARAVSTWAAVAGASAVVGLLVSGSLLEAWSWRSVFLLNVVLAAVALVGTLRFVPESAEADPPAIDTVGALLAFLGLAALVYSVIEAPDRGWGSWTTLGGIALGLIVLALFAGWELKQRHPLLDPRLFRNHRFAAGSLSIMMQFFGFFGFVFVIMQYFQLVRGDSGLIAAVSMLPMAAAMVPMSRLSPRLTARFGTRRPWVLGLLLMAAGLALLSGLHRDSSYWLLVCGLLPLGGGMGLAMTPATTEITDALPPSLQNVGSAMNDLSRELGGAMGIAVLGSILTALYSSNLTLPGMPGAPAALVHKAQSSLAAASVMGDTVKHQAQAAFTDGLQGAFLCASGIAVLTALAVAVLLRRSRADSAATGGTDQ